MIASVWSMDFQMHSEKYNYNKITVYGEEEKRAGTRTIVL